MDDRPDTQRLRLADDDDLDLTVAEPFVDDSATSTQDRG